MNWFSSRAFLGIALCASVLMATSPLYSQSYEDLYNNGQKALKEGRYQEAAQLFERAIQKDNRPNRNKGAGVFRFAYFPFFYAGVAYAEGGDFSKANLEKAILSGANMKFSRFRKANLKQAKMILMNLFQGSLEKADLSNADLSGSNMYAVEFLDAILERTVFKGTNLKMTKLAKKMNDP